MQTASANTNALPAHKLIKQLVQTSPVQLPATSAHLKETAKRASVSRKYVVLRHIALKDTKFVTRATIVGVGMNVHQTHAHPPVAFVTE